jgi:hypothetical protein
MKYITKDSGDRQKFSTGSVRDMQEGKGRFDLIPALPMFRLAGLYERGAVKYGDHNWQKGQPLSRLLDSAERHHYKTKLKLKDEDHPIAVVWNYFAFIWTANEILYGRLPKELDDINYWTKEDYEEATKVAETSQYVVG